MLLPFASWRVGSLWQERQSASACAGRAGVASNSTDVKRVRLNEQKVFITAPGTSCRSPRRPEETGSIPASSLSRTASMTAFVPFPLLLQGADVGDDVLDLGVGQLAVVRRHLAFAVFGDGDERSVGGLDLIGILKGRDLVHLAHRNRSGSIGAVAHGALGFVGVGAGALRKGRRRNGGGEQNHGRGSDAMLHR